ncbi:unnamed protein product [Closterium sp. Naga37s-1]|nr:unnamed protein product [Closterium sp. Naga37s-1]
MKTGGTFQEIVAVAVSLGGLWALLLAQQFPPAVNQVLLIVRRHPAPRIPAAPHASALLLPVYAFVTLGCYAVGALGYGLMRFPTCPHEGALLRQVTLAGVTVARAVVWLQCSDCGGGCCVAGLVVYGQWQGHEGMAHSDKDGRATSVLWNQHTCGGREGRKGVMLISIPTAATAYI